MENKRTCTACTEAYPEACLVGLNEADTGGDTICYRCHVECCPEDAARPAIRAGLARMSRRPTAKGETP